MAEKVLIEHSWPSAKHIDEYVADIWTYSQLIKRTQSCVLTFQMK